MDNKGANASHSANAVEIWPSDIPARAHHEIARQHVIVSESAWGGDTLQRHIARRVRQAKGDAAIILSNANRTETRRTDQHTYQTITREAHIAIVSYF